MMSRPVPPIRDTTMSIPRLADDVRLLGRYPGSGFREPRYLIERRDQRMLQVSRLLFIVAANLDGRHSPEEVADRVSTQYRRRLTTEGLQFLVEAITLSLIGGLIGIVFGVGGSAAVVDSVMS